MPDQGDDILPSHAESFPSASILKATGIFISS
ncbi:hypothetical protein C8J33_101430 [Rhizobium sp. PP-CC-3G-465]|nr:hypothetical protein C8J33_101430 [Rhizobium sp. PP-CC-3G-465]